MNKTLIREGWRWRRKDGLEAWLLSFISFDGGHLTLKLPPLDATLVFVYVESTLLVFDVRLLFALQAKVHFPCSFKVFVLFQFNLFVLFVCFSQSHSLKILHFLLLSFIFLRVSFKHPSFILEYGWFCWWSYCYWCCWWSCFCFFFFFRFWSVICLLLVLRHILLALCTYYCNPMFQFWFWKVGKQEMVKNT